MTTPATPAPLPAEALEAAVAALHEDGCSDPACHYAMHAMASLDADRQIAEMVLEAARPFLAAEFLAFTEQAIIDRAGEVIGQAVAAERERCARQLIRQGWATAAGLLRQSGGARVAEDVQSNDC